MPIEIKVPSLGESVTTATVGKWLKQPGDAVKADEPIVELETDKVSVEVPSPADGRLENHAVAEGDEVDVGAVLATLEKGAAGKSGAAKAARPSRLQKRMQSQKMRLRLLRKLLLRLLMFLPTRIMILLSSVLALAGMCAQFGPHSLVSRLPALKNVRHWAAPV